MISRCIDIDSGIAMVVTDLHGEGDVYGHLRDIFFDLQARGEVDRLIICGDLIHGYGAEHDDYSLAMLMDIMRLQEQHGADKIILLLGNHELPHIYGLPLSKGNLEFTPRFEAALSRLDEIPSGRYHREDVIQFLFNLPFYVRTKAGVLISHAGATHVINTAEAAQRASAFDHHTVIAQTEHFFEELGAERLQVLYTLRKGVAYEQQVAHVLAVRGPDDPRYNHLLREMLLDKNEDFAFLWEMFFTLNEGHAGLPAYLVTVNNFLKAFSAISPYEQRVIIAGHIACHNGYTEVGHQQLRLATFSHAQPNTSGRYLLLDCAAPVYSSADLLPHLRRTFATDKLR